MGGSICTGQVIQVVLSERVNPSRILEGLCYDFARGFSSSDAVGKVADQAARAAKRETRVGARGVCVHQSSRRCKLIAAARATCSRLHPLQGAIAGAARVVAVDPLRQRSFNARPLGIQGRERGLRLALARLQQCLMLRPWTERELAGLGGRAGAAGPHRAGAAGRLVKLDGHERVAEGAPLQADLMPGAAAVPCGQVTLCSSQSMVKALWSKPSGVAACQLVSRSAGPITSMPCASALCSRCWAVT